MLNLRISLSTFEKLVLIFIKLFIGKVLNMEQINFEMSAIYCEFSWR